MKKRDKFFKYFETTGIVSGITISLVIVILAKSIQITDNQFIWDFQWSMLASIPFWALVLAMTSCTCFTFWGIYRLWRSHRIEEPEFVDTVKTYNNKLDCKRENFPDFIEEDNRNAKKRAFKDKYTDIVSRLREKVSKAKIKGNTEKMEMYKQKVTATIEFTTDDFIEENIDSLNVKYEKIYAYSFVRDNFGDLISDRKTVSNEARIMGFKMTRKAITGTITSALLGILITTAIFVFEFNANFWIFVCTTIFSCIWQGLLAVQTAERMFRKEIERPVVNKIDVLDRYIKWLADPKHASQSYLDEQRKAVDEAKRKAQEEEKEKYRIQLEELKSQLMGNNIQ